MFKESEFILFNGVCLSQNILMYVNNKHQTPFWSQQQISTSHIARAYCSQETAFKSKLVFIIDLIVVFNSWRVQKSVK